MILQELVALRARLPELQGDEAFEEKRVDFLIVVDESGRYLGLTDQRDADGRGKPMRIPRQPKRTSGIAPAFLVDNAKYVLGIGGPTDKPDRVAKQKDSFVTCIEEAASRTGGVGLRALAAFYQQFGIWREAIFRDRPASEWTGGEVLAFRLGDDAEAVHLRREVIAEWERRVNAPEEGERERPVRCLATGHIGPPARLHPSLKRVPGGQSFGTSLVAFNAPAFESHGLSQGMNAPVSPGAAAAYADALNWLLAPDPTTGRRHRYGVPLGGDTVCVFWTKDQPQAMDTFAVLANPPTSPDEAVAAMESAWKGLEPLLDATPFFALMLGGNSARAVVRGWLPTTLGEVKRALGRYFEDLSLGVDESRANRPVPLRTLLLALDPPGSASVPPDLGTRMFRASIEPEGALPRVVLNLALQRLRVPPDRDARERKHAGEMLRCRCALIKATLRGIARRETRPDLEVQMALDEENRNVAYVLGRLFAVLERLQGAALGDLNATIRDRYFGGASSAPATVFGKLLELGTKHLSKVGGGLEHYFDERLRRVMRNLEGAAVPAHLPLEDQGLFAIGYFHERDWLISDAKSRSEKKKQGLVEANGDRGEA